MANCYEYSRVINKKYKDDNLVSLKVMQEGGRIKSQCSRDYYVE